MSFPGGSVVKNPPANAGDLSSSPWLGRSPGERHGNPHHSTLAWRIPCGVTESQTWLRAHAGKDTVFLCSASPFSKLPRLRRQSQDPPDAGTQETAWSHVWLWRGRGSCPMGLSPDCGTWATSPGRWCQTWAELNCRTVTRCPQRMEGLLRGGKEVHKFRVQKHSVSRQNAQELFVDSETGDLHG